MFTKKELSEIVNEAKQQSRTIPETTKERFDEWYETINPKKTESQILEFDTVWQFVKTANEKSLC